MRSKSRALVKLIQGGEESWLILKPKQQVIKDAIPFLNDIDEITEEHPPLHMRSTLYMIVAMFLGLLLIAGLMKVEIIVAGTGRLATETPPVMIQPIDRAIIRELNVSAGDKVKKGQILATLDPTFTEADVTSLTQQQQALRAQVRRIEAELSGGGEKVLGKPQSADDQIQLSLYNQRQSQYKSKLHEFDEELKRLQSSIQSSKDNQASLRQQLAVNQEVEKMRSGLMQSEFGSKLNYLDSKAQRLRTERELHDSENRLVELEHALQSKQAERQTFLDDWRRQLMETLITIRAEESRTGGGLAKATRMNDLVVLSAPADGVVLDVTNKSVGSVLNGSEPLMTIIPSNVGLMAEIVLSSGEIGFVKEGDEVLVKVDAFPYSKHGALKGILSSVSEESFAANGASGQGSTPSFSDSASNNGAYHRGRIKLTDTTLEHMPGGTGLIPGMTVNAEIKVGSRSVLTFFLDPITRTFHESIREP
jgi:hemolysin D